MRDLGSSSSPPSSQRQWGRASTAPPSVSMSEVRTREKEMQPTKSPLSSLYIPRLQSGWLIWSLARRFILIYKSFSRSSSLTWSLIVSCSSLEKAVVAGRRVDDGDRVASNIDGAVLAPSLMLSAVIVDMPPPRMGDRSDWLPPAAPFRMKTHTTSPNTSVSPWLRGYISPGSCKMRGEEAGELMNGAAEGTMAALNHGVEGRVR